MMKRDTNNSRTNLEANTSVISNKSRTNTPTANQQKQPTLPVGQSQFATQPPIIPQQSFALQQTQIYAQQQQVHISSGSNFLSQTNTASMVSLRTNPQSDPFASYQQSSVLNTRAITNQVR